MYGLVKFQNFKMLMCWLCSLPPDARIPQSSVDRFWYRHSIYLYGVEIQLAIAWDARAGGWPPTRIGQMDPGCRKPGHVHFAGVYHRGRKAALWTTGFLTRWVGQSIDCQRVQWWHPPPIRMANRITQNTASRIRCLPHSPQPNP